MTRYKHPSLKFDVIPTPIIERKTKIVYESLSVEDRGIGSFPPQTLLLFLDIPDVDAFVVLADGDQGFIVRAYLADVHVVEVVEVSG